jgi:hypothetical protein
MGSYKYIRDSLASGYAKTDLSDIQARLVLERQDGLYKKIPESKADEMLLSQRAPKVEEYVSGGVVMTRVCKSVETRDMMTS